MTGNFNKGHINDRLFESLQSVDNIAEQSVVHKFGRNEAVSTTLVPVTIGGIYRTPQPAAATALRVKAGDANDTALGSGAREITLQGLDETGALVTEAVATAGLAASANTSATFIRLFRAYVSKSGTYATATAGSHADDIVIENAAGTEDWLTIDSTIFPTGQSEVGVYSIPLGKVGLIINTTISVDSTKSADVLFFQRSGILDAAADYQAMRLQSYYAGANAPAQFDYRLPLGPFPALTDIGFMARAPLSSSVSVAFELLLNDE